MRLNNPLRREYFPVCIMAADSCLNKTGCHNRLAQCYCLFLCFGTDDLHFKECRCTLAVSCNLSAKDSCIHRMKCFRKKSSSFVIAFIFISRKAAPCIAINRNHIVSVLDIFAECFLKQCFGNVGICCNKNQAWYTYSDESFQSLCTCRPWSLSYRQSQTSQRLHGTVSVVIMALLPDDRRRYAVKSR